MSAGKKYDSDKIRWDLVPFGALESVAKIITFGAKKYGENNWKTLENFEDRYFAAFMRHIMSWRQGEEADPESGEPHLAHAMCNLLFLLDGGEKTKYEVSSRC